MNQEFIAVMHECTTRSIEGNIPFPEVVRKLSAIGVERYHADLTRMEKTYYLPSGESHVESLGLQAGPIAKEFSAAAVDAALKQIQRGEIVYVEFLRKIMAAGCVEYSVYISGRRALYLGRNGDVHVEPFPQAAKSTP